MMELNSKENPLKIEMPAKWQCKCDKSMKWPVVTIMGGSLTKILSWWYQPFVYNFACHNSYTFWWPVGVYRQIFCTLYIVPKCSVVDLIKHINNGFVEKLEIIVCWRFRWENLFHVMLTKNHDLIDSMWFSMANFLFIRW